MVSGCGLPRAGLPWRTAPLSGTFSILAPREFGPFAGQIDPLRSAGSSDADEPQPMGNSSGQVGTKHVGGDLADGRPTARGLGGKTCGDLVGQLNSQRHGLNVSRHLSIGFDALIACRGVDPGASRCARPYSRRTRSVRADPAEAQRSQRRRCAHASLWRQADAVDRPARGSPVQRSQRNAPDRVNERMEGAVSMMVKSTFSEIRRTSAGFADQSERLGQLGTALVIARISVGGRLS